MLELAPAMVMEGAAQGWSWRTRAGRSFGRQGGQTVDTERALVVEVCGAAMVVVPARAVAAGGGAWSCGSWGWRGGQDVDAEGPVAMMVGGAAALVLASTTARVGGRP